MLAELEHADAPGLSPYALQILPGLPEMEQTLT